MGSRQRVAITGANGYAGAQIARAIERRGHTVIELIRRPEPGAPRAQVAFDLERGVDPETLRACRADVLVHTAWDFRARGLDALRRVNREGAVRLFDAFLQAGGRTGVFISTIAAFDGCRSDYGRVKYETEREALARGFRVVRPGLIRGGTPGGIVGMMLRLVRRLPVVPILGYGHRVLNPIEAEVLGDSVAQLVEREPAGPGEALIVVARPGRLSLDEIVRDMIAEHGLGRRLLIPVPWRPVWLALRLAEALHLPTGLRSDSVISLMNQDPDPPIADHPWFHPDRPWPIEPSSARGLMPGARCEDPGSA